MVSHDIGSAVVSHGIGSYGRQNEKRRVPSLKTGV